MKKITIRNLLLLFVTVFICLSISTVAGAEEIVRYTEGYYTYIVKDGKAAITAVDKSISGDVIVPSELGGYPVNSIGSGFQKCKEIVSVTLPEGIVELNYSAFSDCEKLEKVDLPDSLNHIGLQAFYNTKLYNEHKEGVLYVDTFAYSYVPVPGETEIVIKEGTTGLAERSFAVIPVNVSSIKLPSTLLYINRQALSHSFFTTFDIPENVKIIGFEAFSTSRLTQIHLPKSLEYIDTYAFNHCQSLQKITVDGDNEYYSNDANGILYNKDKTVIEIYPQSCPIEEYTIPDSVTVINKASFHDTEFLKTVNINSNITEIGESAFENSKSLEYVYIPSNVKIIGICAFFGCKNLTTVIMEEGVTTIDQLAFCSCTKLSNIVFPDSAINIAHTAFNQTQWYNDQDDYIVYAGRVLYGCKSNFKKAHVAVKDGTVAIADNAFLNKSKVQKLILPLSVKKIGTSAFNGVSSYFVIIYEGTKEDWSNINIGKNNSILSTPNEMYYSKVAHVYDAVHTDRATFKKGGLATYYCDCGKIVEKSLKRMGSAELSYTECVYDGKEKTPEVIIKTLAGKILEEHRYYEVEYSPDRVKIGKYDVNITLDSSNYYDTKTLSFTIKPGTTGKINSTPSETSLNLTWKAVSGATGYRVYKYNTSTKKYEKIKSITATQYNVKKLKAGTTYKFKIRAYTKLKDGTVIFGDDSNVFATATKPAKSTLKVTSTSKGKANFSWTNVSGETGFQVWYSSKKDSGYKKVSTYKANVVKGSKSKLTSGKKYYFKVRAYKKVDGKTIYGSFSSVKSVKIK